MAVEVKHDKSKRRKRKKTKKEFFVFKSDKAVPIYTNFFFITKLNT